MTAAATLAARVTLPYRRGAELQALAFDAPAADGSVPVHAYDFLEYEARWGGAPAAPAYVVAPTFDVRDDDITLTFTHALAGGQATTTLAIPAGTRAGTSFCLPLPAQADAGTRLRAVAADAVLPVPANTAWQVIALLGNIARLVAVLGAEKDVLRLAALDTLAQRRVATASGAGLDALGRDLRVPRFPPRPHAADADTRALWHLDEAVADGAQLADATTRQGVPGHPAVLAGARPVARGKYGGAYRFAGDGGAIVVPSAADFDIGVGADATIEAFVAVSAPADAEPRAVVARRAAQSASATLAPGWALCIVNARGIVANPMFALCDGTRELRCHADVSIADGALHHLAGVVDRARRRARLYVDGVQRASVAIDALGAIAPPDDLRIGATAAGSSLTGIVDEVRFSGVARTSFHPVLGEDDDAYRARLALFRQWQLPTRDRLIALVNKAAPLAGDAAPYVLVEANRPTHAAECGLRVVPVTLPAGMAIGVDGQPARDDRVAGTPADDIGFDPGLDLLAYSNPAVDAAGASGGARMQAGTAALLDTLARRLADAAVPGKLLLVGAFDAAAGAATLQGVGRALRLRHATLQPDALAAWAHRAGFDYVRNTGPDVTVAVAAGERIAIRSAPGAAARADAGAAFALTLDPPPPGGAACAWTLVAPNAGRAHLAPHPADPAALRTPLAMRTRVQLALDAPGDVEVRVEVSCRGVTRQGTLALRIDPVALADGTALDAGGNTVEDAAATVAAAEPDFTPAWLVTHAPSAAIDFGADPAHARMQVAALDALDALVALLAARAQAGRLVVVAAYDAGAGGPAAAGRLLQLRHEQQDPGTLGALAARSFDAVQRNGDTIVACVRADTPLSIRRAAGGAAAAGEVLLGTPLPLTLLPSPLAAGAVNWSLRAGSTGAGTLSTLLRPATTFVPTRAGAVVLAAIHVTADNALAAPRTFELRLKPGLDVAQTRIPKPQYDIVMNILDAFHPLGVEVRTAGIRSHVPEIEQDITKAFPAYSFPGFRF